MKYAVRIYEELTETIIVEATSRQEAESKVVDAYYEEKIVLIPGSGDVSCETFFDTAPASERELEDCLNLSDFEDNSALS